MKAISIISSRVSNSAVEVSVNPLVGSGHYYPVNIIVAVNCRQQGVQIAKIVGKEFFGKRILKNSKTEAASESADRLLSHSPNSLLALFCASLSNLTRYTAARTTGTSMVG
jgi:hypothetical protein